MDVSPSLFNNKHPSVRTEIKNSDKYCIDGWNNPSTDCSANSMLKSYDSDVHGKVHWRLGPDKYFVSPSMYSTTTSANDSCPRNSNGAICMDRYDVHEHEDCERQSSHSLSSSIISTDISYSSNSVSSHQHSSRHSMISYSNSTTIYAGHQDSSPSTTASAAISHASSSYFSYSNGSLSAPIESSLATSREMSSTLFTSTAEDYEEELDPRDISMSYSCSTLDDGEYIASLFVETKDDDNDSDSNSGSEICNSDICVDAIVDLPYIFDDLNSECDDECHKMHSEMTAVTAKIITSKGTFMKPDANQNQSPRTMIQSEAISEAAIAYCNFLEQGAQQRKESEVKDACWLIPSPKSHNKIIPNYVATDNECPGEDTEVCAMNEKHHQEEIDDGEDKQEDNKPTLLTVLDDTVSDGKNETDLCNIRGPRRAVYLAMSTTSNDFNNSRSKQSTMKFEDQGLSTQNKDIQKHEARDALKKQTKRDKALCFNKGYSLATSNQIISDDQNIEAILITEKSDLDELSSLKSNQSENEDGREDRQSTKDRKPVVENDECNYSVEKIEKCKPMSGTFFNSIFVSFPSLLCSKKYSKKLGNDVNEVTTTTDAGPPMTEITTFMSSDEAEINVPLLSSTFLTSSICKRAWNDALAHLDAFPMEARLWVEIENIENQTLTTIVATPESSHPSPTTLTLLPLHVACYYGAPFELIRILVNAYPEATHKKIPKINKLALHVACEKEADPKVISCLINSWPMSIYMYDSDGNIPLTKVILSKPLSPRKKDIFRLLLKETSKVRQSNEDDSAV